MNLPAMSPISVSPHQCTATLRIEGWRGINHSYALVNQHQLMELAKIEGLRLFHRDVPFAFQHWNRDTNTAGFSAHDQEMIDRLADDPDDQADYVYRICSPFREDPVPTQQKLITFMVTETGLSRTNFADPSEAHAGFTSGENIIVTPTRWAKQRIAEYGFPDDKIYIIPHGVDADAFRPLSEAERISRRDHFGYRDEETVFLNIGVALWNKGIDVLLRAFARVRAAGYQARLILKDQRDVYGISVQDTIRSVAAECPELLRPETLSVISLVRGNLSQSQLRALYGLADCYVSAYRAEGFNMPVLEAIATGLPVIVTRGGATDDFCDDNVAYRISGQAGTVANVDHVARFIEPDLDELTEAMMGIARNQRPEQTRFAQSRQKIIDTFQWRRAASMLTALMVGDVASPIRLAS